MISKDQRQDEIVEKIIKNKGRGYLDIIGGFGKTYTIIKFIKKLHLLRPNYTVKIVVPTTELKDQWIESLEEHKIKNYNVEVINGLTIKNIPFNTHLTILDEAHLWLKAKIFSRVFQLANGPYLIAMSGTWSPEDKRIIGSFLPLIDEIGQQEAVDNSWISKSIEYNLAVEMTAEEKEYYKTINQRVDEYFANFGHDFKDAQSCMTYGGSLSYIRRNQLVSPGFTDEMLAKNLSKKANIWQEFTQKRTNFIHSHLGKIEAVADILNSLPDRKFITFGALKTPSEKLTSLVFNSKTYHSGLNSIYINSKEAEKHGFKIKKDQGLTKISKANLRKLYISQFNLNEIRGINTVKAADLGLDIKNVNTSIIYGRNSKGEKNDQRIWRATRKEGEDKLALLINVYLKGTQDEKWLKNCQKGKRGIISFSSTKELIEHFRNLLND